MNNIPGKSDVVIIGSGAAGLAAAATLAEKGVSGVVFEKQRSLGGTSNFFHGTFAVESEMQRADYITYSRDQAFKNIMDYSHWRANPRLVRATVDLSADTIGWLTRAGVEFLDVTINMPDAHRTYHRIKGRGEAVVKALATKAREKNTAFALGTTVKRIIKSGNRISGVIADADGEEMQVSTGVVIIASGGYANHKEWIKKYAGFDLDNNLIPLGNVDKTGDGIRMAWEAGAAESGMGMVELLRTGPIGPGFSMGDQIENAAIQPDLWVNQQGERFCDETVGFYDTESGWANALQTGGQTYSLFDDSIKQRMMETGVEKTMTMDFPPGSRIANLEKEIEVAVSRGSSEVFAADSLEALASKIGVEPATLKATVEEYNGFCSKGHDDLFAKNPRYLRQLTGPRFYAIKARTVFLGTMGGIKINQNTEVLDKKDRVIPGLYAGGYDAGGIFGDSYCIRVASGLSSAFALNSGRIAGRNALKYLGRS
ncbi:MAG: FAD-dependent oxidoreductase [Dehalococcoidales bacterium]|nr:FAD-dependent oxidoreductase [Dehalococcoidales bacterium]